MIIAKTHIEKDLRRLHVLYSQSISGADPSIPVYYSKLGVLELAGWVEECFDAIAYRAVKRQIATTKFIKLVDDAVSRNYGFSYDNNFLTMMAKVSGLPNCERLEQYLNKSGGLSILKGELTAIEQQRRIAAHVPMATTKIPFDSPSVTIARLRNIHPIMKAIYRWFC